LKVVQKLSTMSVRKMQLLTLSSTLSAGVCTTSKPITTGTMTLK